ncbi:hypothetical protein KC340_g14003 [Hortaea werneckii]|nr:hypothetical protein KC342_g15251 [Hortaea werneckii]KAI7064301.1 hypothetical protein KC339_g16095 [Hortaea werneckii]KAI7211969.1 hypothetical protein KC365_g14774 [Hortaea werneckii]KAI7299035.1 hypothetical protein KC340_g14003 [Hortaea werneckii]KAI7349647.1 hypothetical protein KC354_g13144 [Hortaea werneckii]
MPSPTSSSKGNPSESAGKDSAQIRKELIQNRQEIKKLNDLLESKSDAAMKQVQTLDPREKELKAQIRRRHERNVKHQAEIRSAAPQPRTAGSWSSSGTGSPGTFPQTPRKGVGETEFGGMLTTQEEAVQGEYDAVREMRELEERRAGIRRALAEEKKGIKEEIRKLEQEREELRGQLGGS